jgi:hypothetical protein
VGWRIDNPEPGEWLMLVDHANVIGLEMAQAASPAQAIGVFYQVLVSGPSNLTMDLLLPDRLGTQYFTGQRVPIYALISHTDPISGLVPVALVTSPDGTPSSIPLHDDGNHGDGAADDGFYAGLYTLVNQAEAVPPKVRLLPTRRLQRMKAPIVSC